MSVRRRKSLAPACQAALQPLEQRMLFAIAVAESLLVDVNATALAEGDISSIVNNGTLRGSFLPSAGPDQTPRIDQPVATATTGTVGIRLDGNDFLQLYDDSGALTPAPAGIVGVDPTRTVEVWAWNPALANEETMVAFGRRGEVGRNASFNFGNDARWGAVGHWGDQDIGWGASNPTARQWHHLVYTFDGTTHTTRVYIDGVQANSEVLAAGAINTFPDLPINIGAQTAPNGTVEPGLRGNLTLGKVRIHDGVLTPDQVANNYNEEKAQFVEPVLPVVPQVKLVDIDPTRMAEGAITSIPNTGTLGGAFTPTGGGDTTPIIEQPLRTATSGTVGIHLDGDDYLQSTDAEGGLLLTPASVVGPDPQTSIEVWAWNPALSNEETMVAWGHRNGPDGTNMSFNYGSNPDYGAVGRWGPPDIGWGTNPAARQWHHLVYTYDGNTSRVYVDGQLTNSELLGEGAVNTWGNHPFNIGTQLEPNGTPTGGLRGLLTLGRVKIYSGVLTPEQINNDFNAEKTTYIEPAGMPPPPPPPAAVKLVDIDATNLAPGAANDIPNTGTLGGFFSATGANQAATTPVIAPPLTNSPDGTKGIRLDGNDFLQLVDAPEGNGSLITAPASITGFDAPHSVETWVWNPGIATEETILSWGRREGLPDGTNASFNYGSAGGWGAVGRWGDPDIGWGQTVPAAQQWHHLVNTFDGNTSRVYVDGVLVNSEMIGEDAVKPLPNTAISIGTQLERNASTPTNFLRGSMTIGKARVYAGVLTAEQIAANYNGEKGAFVNPTAPAPAALSAGPIHRYSFNNASGTAPTGTVIEDLVGDADGTVLGGGATFNGTRLVLPGGGSDSAAYVDLPNGLVSSNGAANSGTGQLSIEGWIRHTGNQSWSRIYDIGSSNGRELTGPGGAGNGSDFVMLTAQTGGDPVHRFEVTNQGDPKSRWDESTGSFNQELHFVLTWDEASGVVKYYENGKEVGGLPSGVLMSDINDVNVWLGRSQFTADANFQGQYDEFRLYNRVLSGSEVLGDFQAGPDVVTGGAPNVSEVFVRGSQWTGAFKSYLENKGLGDDVYGYRVFGPGSNAADVLPWINVDEVVLKYSSAPSGGGVPTPGTVAFTSEKGQTYTIASVTPVAGDTTAYVVTLNKPLGGGNPTTGVAPTPAENGDRITVGVPGGGLGGSNFTYRMNVLQGDTDHTGEVGGEHSVLAADFSAVKKKFFKDTTDTTTGDTSYSAFHDVNGSGSILANDFSEVKKRFFQNLAAPPAAAAALALDGVGKDLFSSSAIL
jgi:hypothetical protein